MGKLKAGFTAEYVGPITPIGPGQSLTFVHGLGARPLHVQVWAVVVWKATPDARPAAGPQGTDEIMVPHTDYQAGPLLITGVSADRIVVRNGNATEAAFIQVVAW